MLPEWLNNLISPANLSEKIDVWQRVDNKVSTLLEKVRGAFDRLTLVFLPVENKTNKSEVWRIFKEWVVEEIENPKIKEVYTQMLIKFNSQLNQAKDEWSPERQIQSVVQMFGWLSHVYVTPPVMEIEYLWKLPLDQMFLRLVSHTSIHLNDACLTSGVSCYEQSYFLWRLFEELWFSVWIVIETVADEGQEDAKMTHAKLALSKAGELYKFDFDDDDLHKSEKPWIYQKMNWWDDSDLKLLKTFWLITEDIALYFQTRIRQEHKWKEWGGIICSLEEFKTINLIDINETIVIYWGKIFAIQLDGDYCKLHTLDKVMLVYLDVKEMKEFLEWKDYTNEQMLALIMYIGRLDIDAKKFDAHLIRAQEWSILQTFGVRDVERFNQWERKAAIREYNKFLLIKYKDHT